MIQNNNNWCGLPFYTDEKYRNAEKWWVQSLFRLISPNNWFIPFQLIRDIIPTGGTCAIPSSVDYTANWSVDVDGWEVDPTSLDSASLSVSGGKLVVNASFGGSLSYLILRKRITTTDYRFNAADIQLSLTNTGTNTINFYIATVCALSELVNTDVAPTNTLNLNESMTGDERNQYIQLVIYSYTTVTQTFEINSLTASAVPYALITPEFAYESDWTTDLDGWAVFGTTTATLTKGVSSLILNFNSETEATISRLDIDYSNDNIVDWTLYINPAVGQASILKSFILIGIRKNGSLLYRQISANHNFSSGAYTYSTENLDDIETISDIYLECESNSEPLLEFNEINLSVSIQCVEESATIFTEAVIIDKETGTETDITTYMNSNCLLRTFSDYDVIIFDGGVALPANMEPGYKSLRLTDAENVFYSDWFLPCSNLDEFIKIEFWRDTDLIFEAGRLVYSEGFIQTIYLEADLAKPKYIYEVEETERNGYFFNEKTISKKRYNIVGLIVPEFMVDVLSRLPNHEYIIIQENEIQNRVTKIEILEAEWQDTGDLALLPIEFETNTVISSGTQVTGNVNELLANETEAINIRGNSKRIFQLNDVSDLDGYYLAIDNPNDTEASRISVSDFKAGGFDYIDFNPQDSIIYKLGRLFYDENENTLSFLNDIENVSLQIGEELRARLTNDNAYDLFNGKVGYVKGYSGTDVLCDLAIANDINKSILTLGLFTNDIGTGENGYITRYGGVRNLNTSVFNVGDILYLSPDVAGELTNTKPKPPNYVVRIGICLVSDPVNGIIGVDTISFNGTDTIVNIDGAINGLVIQKPSSDFIIDTGVVYLETNNENNPTENLNFIIDSNRYNLNTTTGSGTGGKARVALTSGTDTDPIKNYIYIIESSGVGVLTANTTGFPSNSAPLGTCFLKSVTHTTNFGEFVFRRWNNAINNGEGDGILQYITKRLRLEGSKYDNGVDPTVTITTNIGVIDNLTVETTSGIVYQLHEQTFQAKDGTEYYVINHPTTPFLRITDLNACDVDAQGNSLRGVNIRYGLNILGAQNSNGTVDRLFVLLPNGSYSNDNNAINDVDNYAVTNVPKGVFGESFRICRIVVNYTTTNGGTFTNLLGIGGFQDERGFPLGTTGGGSGSGGSQTSFSDAIFNLYNNTDATKILNFDLSQIATGQTRTLQAPNYSGKLFVGKNGIESITGGPTSQKITFSGSVLPDANYVLMINAYDSSGFPVPIVRGLKETDGFNFQVDFNCIIEYEAKY